MSFETDLHWFVKSARSVGKTLEETLVEVRHEWAADIREELYQIERERIKMSRD